MQKQDAMHPIRAALQRRWPPMSQAKLARELDVNPALITQYIKGKRTPPDGFYTAAAEVIGCKPDDLRCVAKTAIAAD